MGYDSSAGLVFLNGREIPFSEAIGELHPYVKHCLTIAFGVVPDLDDVINDTLLLVWKNRFVYNGRAKLTTWVYRIACNAVITQRRIERRYSAKSDRLRQVVRGQDPKDYFSCERSPQEVVALIVEEVRKGRDAKDYDIWNARVRGLKYTEISELLGVPRWEVRSRLHRVREWCREQDFLERFRYK